MQLDHATMTAHLSETQIASKLAEKFNKEMDFETYLRVKVDMSSHQTDKQKLALTKFDIL